MATQITGLVDGSNNAIVDASGNWIVISTFVPDVILSGRMGAVNLSNQFSADVEPFIDHDILWRRR